MRIVRAARESRLARRCWNVARITYRIASVVSLTLVVSVAIAVAVGFRVVYTDSIPRGVYWVRGATPHRGSVVDACLPETIGRIGLERGYLSQGRCAGGVGAVAKLVAGVPGDRVVVSAKGVYIDGHRWPWSSAISRDSTGQTLGWKAQRFTVRTGDVFLLGLNPHSWDGRYFGPIAASSVVGVAHPVVMETGAAARALRALNLEGVASDALDEGANVHP